MGDMNFRIGRDLTDFVRNQLGMLPAPHILIPTAAFIKMGQEDVLFRKMEHVVDKRHHDIVIVCGETVLITKPDIGKAIIRRRKVGKPFG